MVKLGFIVEGDSEKIILEKSDFFNYLSELTIEFIPAVRNAKGNGNLLPANLVEHTEILKDQGATKIIILTDLDEEQCITNTKERINASDIHIICISIKMIEAWYLADTQAMRNYLDDQTFEYEFPESLNPFTEIDRIRMEINQRGVSNKKILARQMIKSGFSIRNNAQHANCNSAKYFLNKLNELAAQNNI